MIKMPQGIGKSNWYAANEFETGEHGGTHMDAPYHFNQNGWKVGQIPFEKFFGKVVYLNLRENAQVNPDLMVTEEDFARWEEKHGVMPTGAVVLLDFGWTKKYVSPEEYFGTADVNNKSTFHFPGLSESGARWLIDSGKVFGIGTDTASIDDGQSQMFEAHKLLADNNIYVLEHIAYPVEPLPPAGYKLISMPMKIRNGTGAPCRVLAMP